VISGATLSSSIIRSLDRDGIKFTSNQSGNTKFKVNSPPRNLSIKIRILNMSRSQIVIKSPDNETIYKNYVNDMGLIKLQLWRRGQYNLTLIPYNADDRYKVVLIVELYGLERDLFFYSLYTFLSSLSILIVIYIWRKRI
jgi:hypothetical protein